MSPNFVFLEENLPTGQNIKVGAGTALPPSVTTRLVVLTVALVHQQHAELVALYLFRSAISKQSIKSRESNFRVTENAFVRCLP